MAIEKQDMRAEDNILARVGQHPNPQGNLKIFLASTSTSSGPVMGRGVLNLVWEEQAVCLAVGHLVGEGKGL